MDETFVFINGIKYVNLGIFTYQGKKYLMTIALKPTLIKEFFEVVETLKGVTYKSIDDNVKSGLDKLYNKQDEVIYLALKGNARKIASYGVLIVFLTSATYLAHMQLKRDTPFTNKIISICTELKDALDENTIKSQNELDNIIIEEDKELTFSEQLDKNGQLNNRERTLLTKLNEKLTTNFEYINFNNFYKNISNVKYFYRNPLEDTVFKSDKLIIAYYNPIDNSIVFSKEVMSQDFTFCFFHEGLHMARQHVGLNYDYPFGRIFNEGGTEAIDSIICDDTVGKAYDFEASLVNFIIRFIGQEEFFSNYFSDNEEAIVSALASSFKDRDTVIAMLSNAEEFFEGRRKLKMQEANAIKVETKETTRDKDGIPYPDDGWTLNDDGTQTRKIRNFANLGVSKKLWFNFTKFHELLLELYYNKQVEKINSDYYINGNAKQNILHFLADIDKFKTSLSEQYSNGVVITAPYSYLVEDYGMVTEEEGFENINAKVDLLKALYCKTANISLEELEQFDKEYQPSIINPLEDFEYYGDNLGGKNNIFSQAYKDIIVTTKIETVVNEYGFELSEIHRKVQFTVNRYKPLSYINQVGNSKTK